MTLRLVYKNIDEIIEHENNILSELKKLEEGKGDEVKEAKVKEEVKGDEVKEVKVKKVKVKEEVKGDEVKEVKGEKKEYLISPSILKKYDTKKIKGVLSITCFFGGKKEYSLHGLWPNQIRSVERSDEIYLDHEAIENNKSIKLNTFRNNYKITGDVSCFLNLEKYFPLYQWSKHGIYANNYDTIDEYIIESCDLALNVIKYLINCEKKHKGDEYTFDDMEKSINKDDSPFKDFFKQKVTTDLYKEIHFHVCAIKENESDTKYKWYFYNPSLPPRSDGRIKNKSKSLKRRKSKSLKRRKSKSLKRRKSKSLKRRKSK
jgi:hypothetical protein